MALDLVTGRIVGPRNEYVFLYTPKPVSLIRVHLFDSEAVSRYPSSPAAADGLRSISATMTENMQRIRLSLILGFLLLLSLGFVLTHGDAQPNTLKQIAPGVWFREGDLQHEAIRN